jgi:cytochrome c biogenesis protein CcmG, thiol:disulfide interchange protein DsbE
MPPLSSGVPDRSVATLSLVISRAALVPLVSGVLLVAGCGGGQPKSSAPSESTVTAAFKGSPPPLASLHSQANQLLGGGTSAFDARLAGLRGRYPVVVNKWASWCTPCQSEFPVFQQVSVAFGKRVAFIGINGKDKNPAAAAFLKKYPVTYPSYTDPSEGIARSIQAATFYPMTVFYNRHGTPEFTHAGPYLSTAALEKDIRRYALQ